MVSNPIQQYWTVEEYLAYEQETDIRHEYIDGEIFAMAGGTENHSLITGNSYTEISYQLRGSSCRAYTSDLRAKISDIKYVYPDFSVVCGEAEFADDNHTMLTNPILVVEVTSPSSMNYDKGLKADYYRSLPSVQAYLLLEQNKVLAQLYKRHDAGWLLQEFDQLDMSIPLNVINCSLPLAEVYRGIMFESSE